MDERTKEGMIEFSRRTQHRKIRKKKKEVVTEQKIWSGVSGVQAVQSQYWNTRKLNWLVTVGFPGCC